MNFLSRCKLYLRGNSNSDCRCPTNSNNNSSNNSDISEEVVAELVLMGFDHAEVVQCLTVAKNCKELACEYLLSGLPETLPDGEYGERRLSCENVNDFNNCKTRDEKISWLHSARGQLILKDRPVLLEFYDNGQLFRMLENPRWNDTLNEWLKPDTSKPQKLIRRRKKRKSVWFHTPNSVSSPQVVFRSEIQKPLLKVPIASKYELLTDGFCVFRNIVPEGIVDAANAVINGILSDQFQQQRLKKEGGKGKDDDDSGGNNDPSFVSGSTNDSAVMALFYASHIFHYVQDLLYGDSQHSNKQSHCGGAQVAFRFSQPRPPNWQKLGGVGWHLDGLDEGQFHAFSFLIGVALNDQDSDFSGNLCLHPGSHYALRDYLRCYAQQCQKQHHAAGGSAQDEYPDVHVPRPDLGEPVQVRMRKGDVVFALHKTAHRGGPNYSTEVRRMIYFRVSHVEHGRLKMESLQNIWAEFAGMQEVL